MEQEKQERYTDTEINNEWSSMLNIFKALIDKNPAPEKIKDDLLALKEAAKNSVKLTPRQREGINDRCQNYLNGTYGKGLSHNKVNQS